MRCKNCFRVVGHPGKKSKILQICGVCRRHLTILQNSFR